MKFILVVILVVILALVVGVLAGLVVMYSGWIDVAATTPDTGLKAWVLSETMDHSVKYHAKNIQAPRLDDPGMIRNGFAHFDQRCAGCHGAPGRARGDMSRGLNPEPPSLVTVLDEWTPAELFWITKNGIKMTGMPAFGVSRTDDELWAIVAFLRKLPDIEPEQYVAWRDSLRAVQRADTTRRPLERDARTPR
jgi:mono/diheme cytochrome c family protein